MLSIESILLLSYHQSQSLLVWPFTITLTNKEPFSTERQVKLELIALTTRPIGYSQLQDSF